MSGEGSYAPKSPDLSSFFSDPVPPQQQQQHSQHPPEYQQYPYQSPHLQPPHQGFYQPPPQYSTTQQQQQQPHNSLGQPYLQSPPQQQQPPTPQSAQPPFYAHSGSVGGKVFTQPTPQPPRAYGSQGQSPLPQQQQQQYFQGYGIPQYQQPDQQPQYGLPHGYPQQQQPPFLSNSYEALQQSQQQPHQQAYQQASLPQHPSLPTSPVTKPEPTSATGMPPRRGAAAAGGSSATGSSAPQHTVMPSPVKTKFPTARIKRIMQADEEVGKVSQQTPIAVGKALEMFMVTLVSKSADVARTKNSKRVTAQMLKQVVESDDQWDFLRDIVKKVDPDEKHSRGPRNSAGGVGAAADGNNGGGPGNGTKLKFDSDSGDEQPKKRGRPGRKKKA